MLRRVRKLGQALARVIWYQGCSDAMPDAAPFYTQRMVKLVRAIRRDFGNRRLPLVLPMSSSQRRQEDSKQRPRGAEHDE